VTYVIAEPCVDLKDRACVEECPVEAIFYEDDVPGEWAPYTAANAEFFDDLGSPGGAAKLGAIDKDHPLVAALPRQREEE
jgi:ferredoxin